MHLTHSTVSRREMVNNLPDNLFIHPSTAGMQDCTHVDFETARAQVEDWFCMQDRTIEGARARMIEESGR